MFLEIIYLAVWAVIAGYCIYSARKIGAISYVAAGFFVFMFVWRLMNLILPINLFAGVYNIIFRVVAGVFLVVILGYIIINRKKSK